MDCPERDGFSAERDRAARSFAEARIMFRARWQTAQANEFRILEEAVTESGRKVEWADRALAGHILAHGCVTPGV
jgi:hypothetical protein